MSKDPRTRGFKDSSERMKKNKKGLEVSSDLLKNYKELKNWKGIAKIFIKS